MVDWRKVQHCCYHHEFGMARGMAFVITLIRFLGWIRIIMALENILESLQDFGIKIMITMIN